MLAATVMSDQDDQIPPRTYTDARGKFAKNNPGRPPGVKDRRAVVKEEFLKWWIDGDELALDLPAGVSKLKPMQDRFRALASSGDENIRARIETHMFDQAFGKAKESVDVFHHGEIVEGASDAMRDFWSNRGVVPGLLAPEQVQ